MISLDRRIKSKVCPVAANANPRSLFVLQTNQISNWKLIIAFKEDASFEMENAANSRDPFALEGAI